MIISQKKRPIEKEMNTYDDHINLNDQIKLGTTRIVNASMIM